MRWRGSRSPIAKSGIRKRLISHASMRRRHEIPASPAGSESLAHRAADRVRKRRPRALDAARLCGADARGLCRRTPSCIARCSWSPRASASCRSWCYEGAAERDAHPLLDLLARPNPRQDGAAFLESVCAHLLLAGNAYIEAVTRRRRGCASFTRCGPTACSVVPGAGRLAGGLRLHGRPGARVRFDAGARALPPILHLTLFHPLDDHYGLAPLEAAAIAVDTHNAAANWNKALLDNAARPSGALVYAGPEGAVLSDSAVRAAQARTRATSIRARPMPGGRCCSKAGSTGRRCRCRRRTWISWRPSTPRRARSRWPSACRRCCSASPATTPMRTTRRRTACSGAAPCCRSRTASPRAGAMARPGVRQRAAARRRHRPHRGAVGRPRRVWERVTKAPFLTLNEKRTAIGYAPIEGGDTFS